MVNDASPDQIDEKSDEDDTDEFARDKEFNADVFEEPQRKFTIQEKSGKWQQAFQNRVSHGHLGQTSNSLSSDGTYNFRMS